MYILPKNLSKYLITNLEDVYNRQIILRLCINVTFNREGLIEDTTRLENSINLLEELTQKSRSIVVLGHIGRPDPKNPDPRLSVRHILYYYENYFKDKNIKIEFLKDLSSESIERVNENAQSPEKVIFFLENTRFFEGEESQNEKIRNQFVEKLLQLGDTYVNDSFPDYRISVSTYYLPQSINQKYIGTSFFREITELSKLQNPQREFVVVIGGAKLSEKTEVISYLVHHADKILIGGAMAYTFLKAKGVNIGLSKYEEDKIELAKALLDQFEDKIIPPIDHVCISDIQSFEKVSTTDSIQIEDYNIGVDIGPKSIELFKANLQKAKTIFWNGPLGIFEKDSSKIGTFEIAKHISNLNAYKVIGGGETLTVINSLGMQNKFDFVSTGGGASLAFIGDREFPTLDVILENKDE